MHSTSFFLFDSERARSIVSENRKLYVCCVDVAMICSCISSNFNKYSNSNKDDNELFCVFIEHPSYVYSVTIWSFISVYVKISSNSINKPLKYIPTKYK